MICACGLNSDKEGEQSVATGLRPGHAYSLLDDAVVTDALGNVCHLVKIRNPWGNFEWNGDWGDKSTKWTASLREQLQLEDVDDGTFWMDFRDMRNTFDDVQICHYVDDHEYSFTKQDKEYGVYEFMVTKKGQYTFSIA